MKKLTTTILLLLFLTPVTAVAGTWVIFNGVVEGTLKNFNKLGQYCDDDGRSCVGSKYNKADFSVYQPIRDVKVRVFINGALAGQGTTNTAGYYKISWIYGGYYYPYQIRIETTLEHKGGRFTVFNGNGTPYFLYGYSNIVFLGSSNQNPQNLGTWYWGSANATITASNTYEAAWRTWYYSFRYSSKLRGAFTNLKIFDQSDESTHFEKDAFEIHLNKLSQSYSYHRTAHEMGHAASTRASHPSFKFAGQYCYPSNSEAYGNQICNDPANQGHSLTTQEWASAQFEEGMATFLGTVGAFWSSSHEPRYCFGYSSAPCPPFQNFNTSFNLENEISCSTTSQTSRRRTHLSTSQYLRDLYDNNSNTEIGDNVDLSLSKMVDGLAAFYSHSWEKGVNEPFAENLSIFDDLDGGRSTKDFQKHIKSVANIPTADSNSIYWRNCSPYGD